MPLSMKPNRVGRLQGNLSLRILSEEKDLKKRQEIRFVERMTVFKNVLSVHVYKSITSIAHNANATKQQKYGKALEW